MSYVILWHRCEVHRVDPEKHWTDKGEKNTEEAPLGATRFSNSTSPPPTAQSPERRIPADIDPRKPRPKL